MSARPFAILFIVTLAAACGGTTDGTTNDAGSCGAEPVGTTCRKPSGACEAEICAGTTWACPAGDTQVALTATSCSAADAGADASATDASATDGGDVDGGPCGPALAGETCRAPTGGCEAEICVGTAWTCPTGDTPIPLTATSCESSDAGSCGPMPIGGTCRKPSGTCEAQICVGSTWRCPTGDTEVAVTPGSCIPLDGGDADDGGGGATDGGSFGACGAPVATSIPLADGGTVTCYCEGACGCFTDVDAGTRCP